MLEYGRDASARTAGWQRCAVEFMKWLLSLLSVIFIYELKYSILYYIGVVLVDVIDVIDVIDVKWIDLSFISINFNNMKLHFSNDAITNSRYRKIKFVINALKVEVQEVKHDSHTFYSCFSIYCWAFVLAWDCILSLRVLISSEVNRFVEIVLFCLLRVISS